MRQGVQGQGTGAPAPPAGQKEAGYHGSLSRIHDRGTSRACTPGARIPSHFLLHYHEQVWGNITDCSGERVALFGCQSAISALHSQRLPHPANVILTKPTGRKERGCHPLQVQMKKLMPKAGTSGGSVVLTGLSNSCLEVSSGARSGGDSG